MIMVRIKLAAVFALLAWGAATLQGQSTQVSRTWVSSFGSDSNPCSRTAPCKTFAGALAQTLPGGEIDVLDPGSYGAVTILQAVTIDGGGDQIASVTVNSGNGIVVQAGANDIVTLRHLQLNGMGEGANGIRFLSGKNLTIENCRILGFTQNGIDIEVSTSNSADISDTVIKNSGNDGIFVTSASGLVKVGVLNSQIIVSTNNGVEAAANSRVTVHRSYIAGSGGSGGIVGGASACGNLGIDNSDIVRGNNALTATSNCFLNISHSHLGYNTGIAYNQAGGTIVVYARGVANASNGTNVLHDHGGGNGSATYVTEQ